MPLSQENDTVEKMTALIDFSDRVHFQNGGSKKCFLSFTLVLTVPRAGSLSSVIMKQSRKTRTKPI